MVCNLKKILVVDGSNLLFQMFYGMPSRIYNNKGIGIWGVLGFVGALLRIIREVKPNYVAVFFDGEIDNKKKLIDTDYKANRIDYSELKYEETPFSQLPYIYIALEYMGISYAETTSCEVDDWIAGYVELYGNDNEIIISSFDTDFFQLITETVSVLRYRGKKTVICTPGFILEKYGIKACQFADFKSLVGDKADNIVGVERVGVKTAAKLLREFDTLENIINNTEKIKNQAIKEAIMRNEKRLQQNYRLIKLGGIEKIPFELDKIAYIYDGITTMDVLRGIGLKE